jgi:hypothetical protein
MMISAAKSYNQFDKSLIWQFYHIFRLVYVAPRLYLNCMSKCNQLLLPRTTRRLISNKVMSYHPKKESKLLTPLWFTGLKHFERPGIRSGVSDLNHQATMTIYSDSGDFFEDKISSGESRKVDKLIVDIHQYVY